MRKDSSEASSSVNLQDNTFTDKINLPQDLEKTLSNISEEGSSLDPTPKHFPLKNRFKDDFGNHTQNVKLCDR
jgi:hypothetical protein